MKAHKVTGGGGIQLHVEETGNPGGRPILFIHGFSQCRLAWSKQLGHAPFFEDAARFNAELRAFAKGL